MIDGPTGVTGARGARGPHRSPAGPAAPLASLVHPWLPTESGAQLQLCGRARWRTPARSEENMGTCPSRGQRLLLAVMAPGWPWADGCSRGAALGFVPLRYSEGSSSSWLF